MYLEKTTPSERKQELSSSLEGGLASIAQECWGHASSAYKAGAASIKSITSLELTTSDIYGLQEKLTALAASGWKSAGTEISALTKDAADFVARGEAFVKESVIIPGFLSLDQKDGSNSEHSNPSSSGRKHSEKHVIHPKAGPVHPFSPSDIARSVVRQAHHGDCWAEGPLQAMAATAVGQENLSKMIERVGNGYKVTFPGEPNRPVHVSRQEISNDHLANTGGLAVVEAAMIKRDPEHMEHGGDKADAIKLLTGKDATVLQNAKTLQDELARKMIDALERDGIVVAATAKKTGDTRARTDKASRSEALVPGHVYRVEACDGQNVVVQNTWGHNHGTAVDGGRTYDGVTELPAGRLRMSIATYQRKFRTTDTSAT